MLAQVENKIEELNKQRIDEYYKQREENLSNWGLVTKKGKKKEEVPLIVTDEEYEQLIKASSSVGKSGRNPIANVMTFCSYATLVFGVIASFALYNTNGGLGFVYASVCFVASVLLACLFRGLTEVIKLLQQSLDSGKIFKPSDVVAKQPVQQPVYQAQQPQAPQSQQPQQFPQQPVYGQPIYK